MGYGLVDACAAVAMAAGVSGCNVAFPEEEDIIYFTLCRSTTNKYNIGGYFLEYEEP